MRRFTLAAAIALSSVARAQSDTSATLVGRVRDATDSGAIAWAEIRIAGTPLVTRADGRGNFRIGDVPRGTREIAVRALGYSRLTRVEDFSQAAILRSDFYLQRVPHELQQMVVHGRSMRVPRFFDDVYRRGARGWGAFITREQIDSLNPPDVKTLIGTVPGMTASSRGIYFNTCSWGISAQQSGQLWIDGRRVTRFKRPNWDQESRSDPYYMNEFLSSILPAEVQAIEVYPSSITVPAEFVDGQPCGVVAIWTRRGP